MQLNKKELSVIKGGVSGAIITSFIRGIGQLYELGRSLGSSIRRLITKNYC